jgi:hypothetical protein
MKNEIRQILKNHHTRVPQNHSLLKMAFQPDLHAKSAHKNMIEKLQQDNQNYHVHTWKQLFCCQFK